MPKIKIEGYQPKKGNNLDITNPPRGGSGLDQLSLTDEKDAHICEAAFQMCDLPDHLSPIWCAGCERKD